MRQSTTVRVVSPDNTLRADLAALLGTVGLGVEHASGSQAPAGRHACELVHLSAEDAIDPWLWAIGRRRGMAAAPLIFLCVPRAEMVSMAVVAMKAGAWDFLEIPFNGQLLLDSVQRAVSDHERAAQEQGEARALQARFASLTPREREVLEPLVRGWSNRSMAAALGVTEKTIEAYRARVMRKTGAAHLPQLMRMAIRGGFVREPLLGPADRAGAGKRRARQHAQRGDDRPAAPTGTGG